MRKTFKLLAVLLAMVLFSAFFVACDDEEEGTGGQVGASDAVFTLDKTDIELTVGGNVEVLTLDIRNVEETPEWTSSKPSVASVTAGSTPNKATVKGLAEGSAVITAVAGDQVAVCTVTVKAGLYINLVTESIDILVGRTETIQIDTNVTTEITYTSNNPDVATVNSSGLVTGVSEGTANITVSGGNKTAICPVTVTAPVVTLNKELVILSLSEGENTYKLEAQSNGEVEWLSSDNSVATVGDDGLVTAVGLGEATITARFGSAEAQCVVKVKGEIITVTLSESAHTLEPKDSFTLTAEVSPEQTGDDAGVIWSVVSGDNIVSVDGNGTVTSLGNFYGEAVVRATSNKDADAYADCTVTVPDPYADWVQIYDKASLLDALKQGNETKNMYLAGDIDLGGAVIESSMGYYNATFDGRGYEIYNFSCAGLFAGIEAQGVVRNLAITCSSDRSAEYNGLFGLFILGKVENCRFDITVLNNNQSALAHHDSAAAVINNVILLVRNPESKANVHAALFLKYSSWNDCYCAVLEGNTVSCQGPEKKTEAELKTASLYEDWDDTVWNIEDGEIPVLKNGGNIGDTTIELNRTEVTIHKDDTFALIATVKPSKLPAADKAVVWESSDNTVVTVVDGVLTALKEGTATITVTSVKYPDVSITCEVTVDAATVINLTSSNNVSLEIGAQSAINATVNNGSLIYISSDTDIATVDENGIITAVSAGEITVTVQSDESEGKYVTVNVVVKPEVQISIDGETEFDMEIGEEYEIALINNRPDDNGVWTTSNSEVATVENGTVKAVSAGKVTITYTSAVDSSKSVTVKVTVQPEIELDVVASLTIKTETETDLGAVVSRGGMSFVSDDPETVVVTESGKVTGLKEGTANITVTSLIDPTKSAVCAITVSNTVEVTISLDKTSATLDWDENVTLTVRVNVPGVKWESSDESVATVDENGIVTAQRKDGTAVITVTSNEDTDKSATCEITVTYIEPVIEVTSPDKDEVEMEIGDTLVVEFEVSKGTASIVIEGTSGVLSLEENVLTARSAGTVTVKILGSERDGMYYETFTVTVYELPAISITNADGLAEGLKVGTVFTITTTQNRQDGTLSWESSDSGVATVDDGEISAVGEGTVTVTVTLTTNSGKKATASVTVTVYDQAILEIALAARSVGVNSTYQIEHKAAGGTVEWTSSNPEIATVDNTGKVTGKALGKTIITATIAGTAKSQTITIHVYEKLAGYSEVSTVEEFLAITGANKYYLVNDIDFAGTVYHENTFGTMVATIRGNGYSIKNLTVELSGTDVGFIDQMGNGFDMQGVNFVDLTIKGDAIHGGLVRLMVGDAKIANCYFSVNMEARGIRIGVIGMMDGSPSLKNCIFDVTYTGEGALSAAANANPRAAVGRKYNGTVENCFVNQTTLGSAAGKVFAISSGDGNTELFAEAFKTEAQLKTASTFDETWDEYWVIVNGEYPVLKGALVTEPLKIKLDKTEDEIFVGENTSVTAIVTPTELSAEERAIRWISESPEIATVDQNGVVTALKAGTAVIKAVSVTDEEVFAECTVTVKAIVLSINDDDRISELKLNGEKLLGYTVNRGDVVWSSSDDTIATVVDGLVTALGEGRVTITVTSALDPTVYDSITIEIKDAVVITVEINETAVNLDRGEQITLTATVTNSTEGVIWSIVSGDEFVTVDEQTGEIAALGQDGTAVIRATAKDDGGNGEYAYAECTVNVQYVEEVITVENTQLLIPVNGALTLSEIATASKGEFVLSLKDGSGDGIVSVEDNKITALGAGEVVVLLTWSIDYADIQDRVTELEVTVFAPTVEMIIDTEKRSLVVGEASAARVLHVTLDVMPANPQADDIVWTSGNTSVISSVSAGYDNQAYTGTLNVSGEGVSVITATYTVEGIEYKITCEVAVFTADGNWTAVYDLNTFKSVWSTPGNYYLAHDIDLDGATVDRAREDYNSVFNGCGYTVSNFTTKSLFMYNNANSLIENLKLVCTLDNNGANEGILGHHTNGGNIRNCYFDVTFGTNLAGVSPALANHIAGGSTLENVIVVTRNPNGASGTWADFFQTDGVTTNVYTYRVDDSIGVPRKGTDITDSTQYDESWNENWIIAEGKLPELKKAGFTQE